MHFHFSNILLDLPELKIGQIQKENDEVLLHVEPVDYTLFVRLQLKQNHRLLGKRQDQLSDHEQTLLKQLLHYSDTLRKVYE